MTPNSLADAASTKTTPAPTPTGLPAKPSTNFGRWVITGAGLVAIVLTALFIAATVPRLRQSDRLSAAAARASTSPPLVTVAKVQVDSGASERTLPGNAQAYRETALYARTTGYLKQWLVDIGDNVTEGQLIAVIAAPDLDDQLAQAQANLEQARATLKLNEANAALAETTMNRYRETIKADAGAIAKLQIDEQQAIRPEDLSQVFRGKVTRTTNSLDPNTRTLLTQIDVPNPDNALRPGMYLMVKFITNRATPLIKIPGAALVTQSDGQMAVPVLDKSNTVHYRQVKLGRDFGTDIEVVSGLHGDETVIVHPGDALAEGQVVQTIAPEK